MIFRNQFEDFRKELYDTFYQVFKGQIFEYRENAEKELDHRLDSLKDKYAKELQISREQALKYRNDLKLKEKLISRLIRLLKYQETQISTDDFRVDIEFDRPLQLNLLDMIKYREDKHRRVRELKTVVLSMDEYMDLRKKLNELQNQNGLLQTQVQLLKSSVMRDIGTVDDVHR